MTGRELCVIGAKFLKRPLSQNGHGCHIALIEPASYGENPDVIGYRHGRDVQNVDRFGYTSNYDVGTVLLEAKISRSDFLIDKKKPHRASPETGVGKWRYYICPTDLIKPDELPENWGLIYVNSRGHCKVVAGALAVDRREYNGKKYIHAFDAQKQFLACEFKQRNIQNEMNILTMALNRIDDVENVIYLKRKLLSLSMKYEELAHRLSKSDREFDVNKTISMLEKLTKEMGLKDGA